MNQWLLIVICVVNVFNLVCLIALFWMTRQDIERIYWLVEYPLSKFEPKFEKDEGPASFTTECEPAAQSAGQAGQPDMEDTSLSMGDHKYFGSSPRSKNRFDL